MKITKIKNHTDDITNDLKEIKGLEETTMSSFCQKKLIYWEESDFLKHTSHKQTQEEIWHFRWPIKKKHLRSS